MHSPLAEHWQPSFVKQPQLDSAVQGQLEHSQLLFTGAAAADKHVRLISERAKNVENCFMYISLSNGFSIRGLLTQAWKTHHLWQQALRIFF